MSPDDIREKALSLGYDDIGITPAAIPEEDIRAYQKWLEGNKHANLAYMENQMRCAPQQLLPGAKTAIIFITYYKQPESELKPGRGLIASYARGRDYHNVHRKRLKHFIRWLEEKAGQEKIAKGFSDSSPVLERALAVQAGLGWFGKNTLLIHRKFGTYTLLSGLLTTLDIPGVKKHERMLRCGSCTRCLDACPTNALSPYELDAAKCLSYHLIESKLSLPDEISDKNPGYVFGCDICQEACPHNFRKSPSEAEEFKPDQGIGPYLDLSLLKDIEDRPEKLFGTPLNRRGVQGLKHSMKKILGKDRLQS